MSKSKNKSEFQLLQEENRTHKGELKKLMDELQKLTKALMSERSVNTYTYIYVYVYTYVCVYIDVHTHINMYLNIYRYVFKHMYTRTFTCVYTRK